MIKIRVGSGPEAKSLVFSGDIGRWDKPILEDPTVFAEADAVVMESTYGNRIHEDKSDIDSLLADAVNDVNGRGGNLIIPSFAVGRTQEVLYRLNELLLADRIPHLMTFVDSPMAVSVTEVFRHHPELYDVETKQLLRARNSPFAMPNLKMVTSVADSKAINHIKGTAVIIAASGMCTGGRVKHHLDHNIGRQSSLILFVGYQAFGTLGREIIEGKKEIRLFGAERTVRAEIRQIHGFSAHADQRELLGWVQGISENPGKIFVTHGEPEAAQTLGALLSEKTNAEITVPEYGQTESVF